ncbi:hypothetical protein ACP70R_017631 [Stipagrostis hirtigluma subsp. patula]
MEFLQCAMAAWMALCSSSIVLTSDDVDTFTDSPTERCPLFAGEPFSDEGADHSHPWWRLDGAPPPLPRWQVMKVCGRCGRSRLSLSRRPPEEDVKSCSTMDTYFLSPRRCLPPVRLVFCVWFLAPPVPLLSRLLHLHAPAPEKRSESFCLAFPALLLSLLLVLRWLMPWFVAVWPRSLRTRPRRRDMSVRVPRQPWIGGTEEEEGKGEEDGEVVEAVGEAGGGSVMP